MINCGGKMSLGLETAQIQPKFDVVGKLIILFLSPKYLTGLSLVLL